jgi:hypothetical protein
VPTGPDTDTDSPFVNPPELAWICSDSPYVPFTRSKLSSVHVAMYR